MVWHYLTALVTLASVFSGLIWLAGPSLRRSIAYQTIMIWACLYVISIFDIWRAVFTLAVLLGSALWVAIGAHLIGRRVVTAAAYAALIALLWAPAYASHRIEFNDPHTELLVRTVRLTISFLFASLLAWQANESVHRRYALLRNWGKEKVITLAGLRPYPVLIPGFQR